MAEFGSGVFEGNDPKPQTQEEVKQVPVTSAQAKQLKAKYNGLLRYCDNCKVMWIWNGADDPCQKCGR